MIELTQPKAAGVHGWAGVHDPLHGKSFLRARKITFFGDSQTERHMLTNGRKDSFSYVTWFNILNGYQTPVSIDSVTGDSHFGYSGENSEELLAHVPDVIASDADTVFIQSGINSLTDGHGVDKTTTDNFALWDALLSAGKQVVVVGIFPHGLEATNDLVTLVNVNLRAGAIARGLPYTELPDSMRVGGVAGAVMDPENLTDNTHLSSLGSQRAGGFIWADISPRLTRTSPFPAQSDSSIISDSYYWEGGFDGVTNKPNDWTLIGSATLAYAQETASDGGPDWTKVTVTNNAAARSWLRNLTSTGYSSGDSIQAIVEIEQLSGSFAALNLALVYTLHMGGQITYDNYSANAAIEPGGAFSNGVFRTIPATTDMTTTQLRHQIEFYGEGEFRFRKAGIINLSA